MKGFGRGFVATERIDVNFWWFFYMLTVFSGW